MTVCRRTAHWPLKHNQPKQNTTPPPRRKKKQKSFFRLLARSCGVRRDEGRVLFRRSDNSSLIPPEVFESIWISFGGWHCLFRLAPHFAVVFVVPPRFHVYCNQWEQSEHMLMACPNTAVPHWLKYGLIACLWWSTLQIFINCRTKNRCRVLNIDMSRDADAQITKHRHMDSWNPHLPQSVCFFYSLAQAC